MAGAEGQAQAEAASNRDQILAAARNCGFDTSRANPDPKSRVLALPDIAASDEKLACLAKVVLEFDVQVYFMNAEPSGDLHARYLNALLAATGPLAAQEAKEWFRESDQYPDPPVFDQTVLTPAQIINQIERFCGEKGAGSISHTGEAYTISPDWLAQMDEPEDDIFTALQCNLELLMFNELPFGFVGNDAPAEH